MRGVRRGLRRRRVVLIVSVLVGAAAVGLVLVMVGAPAATTRVAESPLVGQPVPRIAGETLDGGQFDIASQRGRWVLVNVFATWCVPCRDEHPHLARFAQAHRTAGDAVVVGIVFDDDPDAVRAFRSKEGGDWPMLVDPGSRMAIDLGVSGVPESFLVAPNGVVVAKITGGVRFDELEALLARVQTGVENGDDAP